MSTSFATPEGLRTVLNRLHKAGPGAWAHDDEAERLLKFAINRYRGLAIAHRCDPDDAGYAAFEAMRTRAVRRAEDPWAVVTRAVEVSLIAEEQAAGLMCTTQRARRGGNHLQSYPRRFSDHETDLSEFNAAFRASPQEIAVMAAETNVIEPPTTPDEAIDVAVAVFGSLGWPRDTARAVLEYIAARTVELGNRVSAHEMLRRDEAGPAQFDIGPEAWPIVLRIVLGNVDPNRVFTTAGRGILTLLLCGYTAGDLMADMGLVLEIRNTAPTKVETDYLEPEFAEYAEVDHAC
jgi:hypothetical protein